MIGQHSASDFRNQPNGCQSILLLSNNLPVRDKLTSSGYLYLIGHQAEPAKE